MKNRNYTYKNALITLVGKPYPTGEPNYARNLFKEALKIQSRQDETGRLTSLYTESLKRIRTFLKETPHYSQEVGIYLSKYRHRYYTEFRIDPNTFKIGIAIKEAVADAHRDYRRSLKKEQIRARRGDVIYEVQDQGKGLVFTKPGQIYEAFVQKRVKELYVAKNPTTNTNYIGLEIEFCSPVKKNELALLFYKFGIHKFGQVKEDGSLRPKPGEYAYELALLFKEHTFKSDLKKVCKVLKAVKAVAEDRRCGLHVHLDMRHRDKEIVYSNLVACQSALLTMVDPRRIDNEFCLRVKSRQFPKSFTGDRRERYKTINAAAFYRYKTLEIRMHEGSVDYTAILNWISLLVKIAKYPKKLKMNVLDLTMLNRRVKMDKDMLNFFQDKSCYWQVNRPDDASPSVQPEESPHSYGARARETLQRVSPRVTTLPVPGPSNPFADTTNSLLRETSAQMAESLDRNYVVSGTTSAGIAPIEIRSGSALASYMEENSPIDTSWTLTTNRREE